MSKKLLSTCILASFAACVGLLVYSSTSAQTGCVNPSPAPTGFAAPCPVLTATPSTVSPSGSLAITTSLSTAGYIWHTVYISQGSAWQTYEMTGSSTYAGWINSPAILNLTTSQLGDLSLGQHWAAAWDWTWNGSCYIGPGAATCGGGSWRIQKFTIATAAITPTPTPPVSTKFQIGDRVSVLASTYANVRSAASGTSTFLGTQDSEAQGTVIGGPEMGYDVLGNYKVWWNINFDAAPDGWVVEDAIDKIGVTPAPTVTPTATPTNCAGPWTILNQQPTTCVPYPDGPFGKKLPNAGKGGPTAHLMPYSQQIVNEVLTKYHNCSDPKSACGVKTGTPTTNVDYVAYPGPKDGNHVVLYYGKASDPTYVVSGCKDTASYINGKTFHAPSAAQGSTADFDSSLAVWDQVTGQFFQFYEGMGNVVTLPSCGSGQTCTFNRSNGYCGWGDYDTSNGYEDGNCGSTAGFAPQATKIRLCEWSDASNGTGKINHAIRVNTLCTGTANGTYASGKVFPNTKGFTALTCQTMHDQYDPGWTSIAYRPPNGGLLFLDFTDAQLNCLNPNKPSCSGITKLAKWQFPIIEALTYYGGYIEDTGSAGGFYPFRTESLQAYYWSEDHGYPGAKALGLGWFEVLSKNCGTNCSYNGTNLFTLNPWAGVSVGDGKTVIDHMHFADPCVAKALAGQTVAQGACP